MKNKPLRHKESNRFKFQPFAERISNINVDVFHRVCHVYEENTDETVTNFFTVYQKLDLSNKSETFGLLKHEISIFSVKTLPELLVKKDHVVNVLLKHLGLKNPLSLQATLELVVALAQDLTRDFYVYYPQFHIKLIKLLATKDADQLEWVFTCLAYLFKLLWRYILKDLSTVFDSLVPLLSASQPQYINNFAADSFAFIARKVKDKRNLLKLILGPLSKTKDGVSGYGRLLFATICGISNNFHSCAEPLLLFLFQCLSDEKLPRNILFQLLGNMVDNITSTIFVKQSGLYWNVVRNVAEEFINNWKESQEEKYMKGLCFILQIIHRTLKWRDASWLDNADKLLKFLINLFKNEVETSQLLIADIVSVILLSPRVILTQEQSSYVINTILSGPNKNVTKDFIKKIVKYSGFDLFVLRRFIEFSSKENPRDTLNLWAKLLLHKCPPSYDLLDSSEPKRYMINFRSYLSSDSTFSESLLNEIPAEIELLDNIERILNMLIILPHVEPMNELNILNKLQDLIKTICNILNNYEKLDNKTVAKLLYTLLSTIKCFTLVKTFKNVNEANIPDVIVKSLSPFIKNRSLQVLVLNCLSLTLKENKEMFRGEVENIFWDDLVTGLSSPFHQVRLQSANALLILLDDNAENLEVVNCLTIIVKAESLPVTVHDYREKLNLLQKIECCPMIAESKHNTLPLQYLLGVLYVNFKLIWDPVVKIITSYSCQLPKTQFWPVFHSRLLYVKEQIKNQEEEIEEESLFDNNDITNFYNKINKFKEKPDHWNYRILLWKSMPEFSELCESKNRDIVPLFFEFLQEEYYKLNSEIASNWNIKIKPRIEDQGEAMDVDEDASENKMEEDNPEKDDDTIKPNEPAELPKFGIPGKFAMKSLLAHMCIFGKIRDPNSMYQEPELRNTYYELLTHKNPEVQKSALNCILTYKNKDVAPYRDHLFGLIDDKSFKNEIVLFRIDTESDVVKPEHRQDLMPIVMRILYGKMLNKSGVRANGKSAGQLKRSLVLRFLAGCQHSEVLMYLQMAFRIYTPFFKDTSMETIKYIDSTLDLGSMIPPKRLQSSVNLVLVVLTQCGGLMGPEILSYLLKILFCIGRIVVCALKERDVVYPGYIFTLRSIRNSTLVAVTKFFELFEAYQWTSEELDTVFEVCVWPWLPKLPTEGVHSPTHLLKLFMAWSRFPRYFSLLGKRDDTNSLNPLTSVMELLVGPKASNIVCNAIMEMVEQLLTLQDLEDEQNNEDGDITDKVQPLNVNNTQVFNRDPSNQNLNYGSFLILDHIPSVLERLKIKLSKKNRKYNLGKRDLTVLSRATELVTDPATSETLFSLMLPIMLKKAKSSDEIVCPILNTLANLIKNVSNPEIYVNKLAPLFGLVSTAESRRLLTRIIVSIARKDSGIDVDLIEDLNSYDERWIEQPDYNRRLDGFKRIKSDTESNKISVEMGIIVIHTCFHFLRTEKDLSLRDYSAQCLRYLCPALCLNYKHAREVLIEQTILPLISVSIRNKQCETVQQESTFLLGYMVRECSELNQILKDLLPLTNKVDFEVDFFENLQHLQSHRRVRALLKLSKVLSSLKKSPCSRTITQFILPLISEYLCEEKYSNKHTLVDAAIEALGTVCKLLPWHQYETILRFYLSKLQHNIDLQKQLVRIVVTVLNGFHFDLSKASYSEIERLDRVNNNSDKTDPNKSKIEDEVVTESVDVNDNEHDKENKAEELEGDEDDEDEKSDENELVKNLAKETDDVTEDASDETVKDTEICVVDKITVLTEAGAIRVIKTMKHSLLVQLLRVVGMRSQSDSTHKLNKKNLGPDRDEEDMLRSPIALAAVKLLKHLPVKILEQNLPGILIKLCTFLKSRLDSVRRVTRETLQKVMIELGPKYLHVLINEMTTMLTKGFQVHVLVYTLHAVLGSMKQFLESGHMDKCLPPILEVCKMDLFGKSSEEKEVAQIAGKLMEARGNKSYDIFHILGEFITEKCLLNVVLPLKEELSASLSHKVVHKVKECLRNLVLGLVDNKFVNTEAMLIFTYGVTSESIPSLATTNSSTEEKEKNKIPSHLIKPDTFIIPEEPRFRPKVQAKQCAKTNAHVLVEFGLQLYLFLLKREKVNGVEFLPLLDPIVSLLHTCLTSEHMKINSLAIQCLSWILKKDLPSLKKHIKGITQTLFSILHKYASSGLSKGENFELVLAAFKTVAVIVRDIKYYKLENEQLQALLLYCEQDIHDHSRQATAFSLLKAILRRKLNIPELHDVIAKVEELSITSHLEHSRLQARQIVHKFLSKYQIKKQFVKHLNFYIMHLDYGLQTGRESVLEMLHTFINTLPEKVLKEHTGLLFVSIAARLVNDDIPECRQKAAEVITSLLQRVDKNEKNNLFDIVILWMKDKKIAHRRLGAQLCGIFVTIEQNNFENNLSSLLPVILQQFYEGFNANQPGMFVKVTSDENKESTATTMEDHHLYQLLNMLVKLTTNCPKILTNSAYVKDIETIANNTQKMLSHPHEWVRLSAVLLLGRIVSVLKPEEVAGIANGDIPERSGFLLNDTRENLKSFALDHCYQLSPGVELQEKLLMQCMKNLVFVAEVLQNIKPNTVEKFPLSLLWLVRHMRKLIHMEVAQTPSSVVVRTMVFHWMAAISLKLNKESLLPVVPHIVAPIVREMNIIEERNKVLRQIAKEASGYVKKKIGSEEYDRLVTHYTSKFEIQRAERRKERAQQVITDPERAAKRRIKKQQKKKDQKKRKIDSFRKHKIKRKGKKEVDLDE